MNTTKRNNIIYWIVTIWLSLGMVSTGIVQIIGMKEEMDNFTHLGYPSYLPFLLAIWKFAGVIAVLVPGFLLLKEWAYAGFFFAMTGAMISHMIVGDPIGQIFPGMLLAVLTIASWYFRPPGRRLVQVN